MLRVRLHGALRLEAGGRALPAPSSRRGRSLLAWLALHPGTHARSELAARLRPDVLDESARLSLRQAAWDVRRALGAAADRLVADRDRIGLVAGEGLWVDVWELDRLLDEGRIDAALELWNTGQLLEGLDEDWVFEARDRVRERLAAALAAAAAGAEEDGNLERAVSLTRKWTALDPLAEAPGRELVRRLAAAGDTGAAVAAGERLGERLRRELGVAPSRQTRTLIEQLRSAGRAATARSGPIPLPPPLAPVLGQGELLGRERELGRLLAAWSAAAGGTAGCVLVGGEPGIGKTRLLAELCRAAHAQGAVVTLGRCQPETLTSYQPFVEALRRWAGAESAEAVREHAAAAGPDLLSLLPELARQLPDARPPAASDRFRMFEAVGTLLASIARQRPLLLALDDAHEADRPSLLLLGHLLRARLSAPLLVAVTYRQTDVGPDHALEDLLRRLRRERLALELTLEGLGREATGALVGRELGSPAPALSAIIHERARGNPFFTAELARMLAASGAVRRRAGRWDYDLETAERAVPRGVHDLIAERVNRVSEGAGSTLRVAAVLGQEFELDVLAHLTAIDEDALLDALEEARAAHFVVELPQPGRFRFAHPLVRETLYEGLTATRRTRLHARAGEALEELRGDAASVGALALHFCRGAAAGASHRGKAVRYAAAAAEEALSRLAYEDAIARWDEALQLVSDRDGDLRAELMRRRGVAYAAHAAWVLHPDVAPRLAHMAPAGATSGPE